MLLLLLWLPLSSCGFFDMSIEQASAKHAEILGRDPPTDFGRAPITIDLPVYDAVTKAPVRDFIISGSAKGILREKYTGHREYPFICHFIPMFCYSEKGGSLLTIDTPIVVTSATAVEGKPSTYVLRTPGGFVLSPGFRTLTNDHIWSGSVSSRDYCSVGSHNPYGVDYPINQRMLHFVAASLQNVPSDYLLRPVYLTPLEANVFTRMRQHLFWTTQLVATESTLVANTPMTSAYADALEWARPPGEDPFEHAAYVSLLTEKGRPIAQGARPNATTLSIISEKIAQSTGIARRIYYQFDDWQLVPATERIEWLSKKTATANTDGACVTPAVAERLTSVGEWGRMLPILRPRDYFVDTTESLRKHNAYGRSAEPMLAALELTPYPFCFRDQRANLPQSTAAKSACTGPHGRPATSVQSAAGFSVSSTTGSKFAAVESPHAPPPPSVEATWRGYGLENRDDSTASCQQREQTARQLAALSTFSVQCKNGAPQNCALDAVNGLGDSALMTLARVDRFHTVRFPFARAPASGNPQYRSVPAQFSRSQAVAMVNALIEAGINVASINPALDVNALEIAIDPFLGGGMTSSDPVAWDAQQLIVMALLDALDRRAGGSIREDYSRALERPVAVPDNAGARQVRQLPPDLIRRIQDLPRRPLPRRCGLLPESGTGRIQHAPNRGYEHTPSPLRWAR